MHTPTLVLAVAASSVLGATYCADSTGSFCVNVSPSNSSGMSLVTVQSSSSGWAGVAFGTSAMSGSAPVFIGWNNGDNVLVSKRSFLKHSTPEFVSTVTTTSTPPESVTDFKGTAGITFSFLADSGLFSVGNVPCVYGISSKAPTDPTSANSSFKKHDDYDSFSLSFDATKSSSPASGSNTPAASGGASSAVKANSTYATAVYCYDSTSSFCVNAVRDTSLGTITVTLYSSYSGWAAIGTGSRMAGSTIFVGWMNQGSPVVSERTASGHDTPATISKKVALQSVPSSLVIPSSASTVFTFSVPENSGVFSLSGPTNFILGASRQGPDSPSLSGSSFPIHSLYTSFSLDVSQLGSVSTATGSKTSSIDPILIHGILMFTAWFVACPAAIFIARYMKTRLGHLWFKTHLWLMLAGVGGLMAAGLLAVEINIPAGEARFFTSLHGVLGTVIALIIYPLQCILGFVSDRLFKPDRVGIPIQDRIHWWLGRSVVLLAIINTQLGLLLYGAPVVFSVLLWLWVVLVVFVLFGAIGEWRLGGVVHHAADKQF